MTLEIARLIVTLNDVEPAVMRRIEAPLGLPLERLHLTLQAAFGWENYHLYAFRARKTAFSLYPEDHFGDGDTRSLKRATLADAIEAAGAKKAFVYEYDFGDGWEHAIRVERIAAAEADVAYPRLVEAKGACPPE